DQTFDLNIEREIIVVNNNSTDRTKELLKEFKDQITVINEKIRSRSKARQAGLNMAKGEFVAFVDADVILDPHWTQLNLKQMLSRPQLGAVQGSLIPMLEKPW